MCLSEPLASFIERPHTHRRMQRVSEVFLLGHCLVVLLLVVRHTDAAFDKWTTLTLLYTLVLIAKAMAFGRHEQCEQYAPPSELRHHYAHS